MQSSRSIPRARPRPVGAIPLELRAIHPVRGSFSPKRGSFRSDWGKLRPGVPGSSPSEGSNAPERGKRASVEGRVAHDGGGGFPLGGESFPRAEGSSVPSGRSFAARGGSPVGCCIWTSLPLDKERSIPQNNAHKMGSSASPCRESLRREIPYRWGTEVLRRKCSLKTRRDAGRRVQGRRRPAPAEKEVPRGGSAPVGASGGGVLRRPLVSRQVRSRGVR